MPDVIETVGDRGKITVPEQTVTSFCQTNYFQSGGRKHLQQQRPVTPVGKHNGHRSPSAGTSNTIIEDEATLEDSNVSYPDLTDQAALAENRENRENREIEEIQYILSDSPISDWEDLIVQEEEDWDLAHRLQQEENEFHTEVEFFFDTLQSVPHQEHILLGVFDENDSRSNKRHAIYGLNMPNSPIDLGWDPDAWDEVSRELDDVRPTFHNKSTSSHINPSTDADVETARILQAEEFWNQRGPVGSRECVVCGESILIMDLPSLAHCTHPPETCTDCYAEWITAQLRDSSWREAKCPGNECNIKLEYFEIQQYATQETFQQYDTFIARAAFSEDRKS